MPKIGQTKQESKSNTCNACGGSGKSSKGGQCEPCKGTGKPQPNRLRGLDK